MGWKKIDEDTFEREEVEVKERVKLTKLKDRITFLRNMKKPTKKELEDLGTLMHEYFTAADEIRELEDLQKTLEAL